MKFFDSLFFPIFFAPLALATPATVTLNAAQNDNVFPACLPDNPASAEYPCLAIIQFEKNVSDEQRQNSLKEVKIRLELKSFKASAVLVPNVKAMEHLLSDSQIANILPDQKIEAFGGKGGKPTSATGQVVPEGIKAIGANPGVLSVSGQDVGIAVIDTGVDMLNADLRVSESCFSAYTDCQDRNGHGTHVAGIIAALNNNIDVVGVAPLATIYAAKALDDNGSGTDSSLILALEWIANASRDGLLTPPIDAVNMSLGRVGNIDDNPLLRSAITDLTNNLGISVIVAAGNDPLYETSEMVPASYPEVLAVASTSAKSGTSQCRSFPYSIAGNTASFFTTDGPGVTVSAPGEENEDISRSCQIISRGILSLKPNGGTVRLSGTSMAAPHVTGVVALIVAKFNGPDVNTIRDLFRTSASASGVAPIDSPTKDYSYDGIREGVVSACRALGECH